MLTLTRIYLEWTVGREPIADLPITRSTGGGESCCSSALVVGSRPMSENDDPVELGPASGSPDEVDVRFGHDLSQVQDANGVDLLLLEEHLKLTVEERLERLEQRVRQIAELRAGMRRC